jgi:hypothetical protein
MSGSPHSIEFSVRIYKTLIKAYPASFRREYENEMSLVFREHITDVLQKRGTVGLMTAWFRLLGDLAWSAPKEHFLEMQRRIAMKNAMFAVFCIVVAGIIQLYFTFLLIGLTTIFIFIRDVSIGHLSASVLVSCDLITLIFGPIPGLLFSPGFIFLYFLMFLTGMMLTSVKPFFRPFITVPLIAMMYWGWMICIYGKYSWWTAILFVMSIGLVTLIGCFVTETPKLLQKVVCRLNKSKA